MCKACGGPRQVMPRANAGIVLARRPVALAGAGAGVQPVPLYRRGQIQPTDTDENAGRTTFCAQRVCPYGLWK